MTANLPDGGADDWRQHALCSRQHMPDWWYSEENTTHAAIAAAACFQCPVRKQCLKEACDSKEQYGIWGGLPASIRSGRPFVHNFIPLVELTDPYETEDSNSVFHISNWIGRLDERE